MGTEIHSNKLRSHCQFPIENGRKVAQDIIGISLLESTEKDLRETILSRIPKGDETKREFDVRWVLSCYVVYSEVKEKAEEKAETKRAMGDAIKDIVKENKLPKSLEIKENRVTSQNLITTDYMDLEKNVVQAVM
ncbi:MAG: hypothetical protein KAR18_10105 [Spirochaetes bacterium]|nr:hypothetical protein [Spirochaetota bacterium]